MPSIPPALDQWLQPGLVTAALAMLWYEVKASEVRQGKRIDGLRDDVKAREVRQGKQIDELRDDMKASEARQGKQINELRDDMKASEARQRDDMKASEARQRDDIKAFMVRQQQDMAELKADNRAMAEKLDRLLEGLLAVRQP